MTKRYPKDKEQTLAYRIASSWAKDSYNIAERGLHPASLTACLEDRYWIFDHIYEFEHEEVTDDPMEATS